MTKTEIKQDAQDRLMDALQVAFYTLSDADGVDQSDAIAEEMNKQMARIEKLFGYTPNSWGRG